VTIHLSDLPGGAACAADWPPQPRFWPCSQWGLPSTVLRVTSTGR